MEIISNIATKYNVLLSQDSIGSLVAIFQRGEYDKNQFLLEQGQICRYMYIVESGMLRQFYYKDGRDITEHFSCEGSVVFCIESLFKKEPTKLWLESIEPSVVYLVEYSKLKALTYKYPDINLLLQTILESDLVESQRKADSWRFESSHKRYERFCREYPSASKRAPIAHIASYLLMSPETLSRVRAGKL